MKSSFCLQLRKRIYPTFHNRLIGRCGSTRDGGDHDAPFVRNAEKENAPRADSPAKRLELPLEKFQISLKRIFRHFFERGFDPFPIKRGNSLK
jgi:hypothetical protein